MSRQNKLDGADLYSTSEDDHSGVSMTSHTSSPDARMARTIQRLASLHITKTSKDYEDVIFSLFEMFSTTIQIQSHQIERLEKKVEEDRINRHLDSRNVAEMRREMTSIHGKDSLTTKPHETPAQDQEVSSGKAVTELAKKMDHVHQNTEQNLAHLENGRKAVEAKLTQLKTTTTTSLQLLRQHLNEAEARVQDKLNEIQLIFVPVDEMEKLRAHVLDEIQQVRVTMELQLAQINDRLITAEDGIAENKRDLERTRRQVEKMGQDISLLKHMTFDDGTFHWLLEDFSQRKTEAVNGEELEIYSPTFYSHYNGYQMRMQLYPNGLHGGRFTHISLFVQLMCGPHDDSLAWPYSGTYQVSVVRPGGGPPRMKSTNATVSGDEKCWRKPEREVNTGYGWNKFLSHDHLPKYLKNDKMLIIFKRLE